MSFLPKVDELCRKCTPSYLEKWLKEQSSLQNPSVLFSYLSPSLNDERLKVEEQIEEYRQIYLPYSKAPNFNPHSTPIPELASKIYQLFAYVWPEISNDQEKTLLFRRFWDQTVKDSNERNLTLQYFKFLNQQMALLLIKKDQISKTHMYDVLPEGRILQELYDSEKWLDIKNFSKIKTLPIQELPFSFEAIIYHPPGELPLEAFLGALFDDPDLILGLSVLPKQFSKGGPHGATVNDPAIFLVHDQIHCRTLALTMKAQQAGFWSLIQSLLQKIYDQLQQGSPEDRQFGTVGLFLLTHEFLPQDEKFLKRLIKEKGSELSLSESHAMTSRGKFAQLIESVHLSLERSVFDPTITFLQAYMKTVSKRARLPYVLYVESCKKCEDNVYKVACEVLFPANNFHHKVGDVTYLVKIQPANISNFECCSVTEVIDFSSFYENKCEDVPELKEVVSFDYQWLLTSENIPSRLRMQQLSNADYIQLLNMAYKTHVLSPNTFGDQMVQALRQYFLDFYEKYKHLFSSQDIEVDHTFVAPSSA